MLVNPATSVGSPAGLPQVFVDSQGVAISGYDVVAYFVEKAAHQGDPQWRAEYLGATFYFRSASNRDLFLAEPQRYVPQFRGYCAYAMSAGKIRKCDPRRFSVSDSKLYLFSSERARERWLNRDLDLVSRALAAWRALFSNQ